MWKGIFSSIFHFIFSPKKAWTLKRDEDHPVFLNQFLYPVFGLIALATFVGGMRFLEKSDIQWALKQTIAVVTALFSGFYATSYLLNELFPKFGITKNLETAQRFIGYSSVVPYLLFFVTPLLPQFSIIWLAAIYIVVVVYIGTDVYLGVSGNKRIGFTVIASLLIVLVPALVQLLLEFLIIQSV